MHITMRLGDKLGEAIDAAASASGLSRSRWIARLIERELDQNPAPEIKRPKRSDPPVEVRLRIDPQLAAALDAAARSHHMTRNQFVIAALRGRVWTGEGTIALCPIAKEEMQEAVKQIRAIGRNVNQAVHAFHAAMLPDSEMNIRNVSDNLAGVLEVAADTVNRTRSILISNVAAEQFYWRGGKQD